VRYCAVMEPSPLDPLKAATAAKAAADGDAEAADRAWREAIRTAVAHGFRVSVIAEAAGISVPRVYQIRDGRR
jgi:hypothetical protein